ncbi:MAG TPA: hypothetical protein VF637_01030 [Sphingomicrobium sp.]|jgi:hypothetical protein
MFDPRFLAGPAQLVVGLLLLGISYRLSWVHPVNRVFRLGPYVTPEGLEVLLRLRLTMFSFGCMLVSGAASRITYWFAARDVYNKWVVLFGSLEAGLAMWAASLAVVAGYRLWIVN